MSGRNVGQTLAAAGRNRRAHPLLSVWQLFMASREKQKPPIGPEEDEWGFYDPETAGLPAVLGRMESKSDESAASYAARIARTLRSPDRPSRPTLVKKISSK